MKRGARLACAAGFALASGGAHAHGLGQRYDLPIPLWLYLAGAASAVAASFVFLVLLRKRGVDAFPARTRPIAFEGSIPRALVLALQAMSLALFALVIVAGLIGNQGPFNNIAPTAVWVVWWVGFSFLCAFLGNLWPLVSPFALVFRASALWRRRRARPLSLYRSYPARLGAWPAVALYWLFAWTELVAPGRDQPRAIAIALLGYAVLTLIGCFVFGERVWLRRAEAFAVLFEFLGRFGALHLARTRDGWRWRLRPYAAGLLSWRPLAPSLIAFVLLMLALVSVDGLLETPVWVDAAERLAVVLPEGQLTSLLPPTLLLVAGPVAFGVTYAVVIVAMAALAGGPRKELAGRFVLSLVPIAIAYHLAHYLSFLLLAGQLAIPLASDPLGFGWDLFGTKLYRLDIGIVDARFVWLTAVAAIVVGHIVATWLAHETALTMFRDPARARRSQYPMIALMIAYTVTSLWILAQPIVETRPG